MQAKYTKGPWKFHANGDANDYSLLTDGNKWVIGFHQNGEKMDEEQIANAKLIAAAPELLEALKELHDWVCSLSDWSGGTTLDPDIEKVRKAIEKATL